MTYVTTFLGGEALADKQLKSQHVLYDQVTSAIAKLFRDFATLRPASEPLSRPNPLEGKTDAKARTCTLSKFGMDWNQF